MHTLTCIGEIAGAFSDKIDPASPGRPHGGPAAMPAGTGVGVASAPLHPGQRLVPAAHDGPAELGPHHAGPFRELPAEGLANPVVLGWEPGRVELPAQPGGEVLDLVHQILPLGEEVDRVALEKLGARRAHALAVLEAAQMLD